MKPNKKNYARNYFKNTHLMINTLSVAMIKSNRPNKVTGKFVLVR